MPVNKIPLKITYVKLAKAFMVVAQKVPIPPIPTLPGAKNGQQNLPATPKQP